MKTRQKPEAEPGVPSAHGWVSGASLDPRLSVLRGKACSPPRTSAKGKPSSWRGRWCRPSSSGTPCTTTEVSRRGDGSVPKGPPGFPGKGLGLPWPRRNGGSAADRTVQELRALGLCEGR